MKITELIAQHLIDVHEGNNWTEVNLTDTLRDITPEEAGTLTDASPNTIAALVHHITYWNRVMIQRIQGIDVPETTDNGFGVAPPKDLSVWDQLLADNLQSSRELAAAIRSYKDDQLENPILPGQASAYKNFQGTVEHVHYHMGQILILKKLLRGKAHASVVPPEPV